MEKENQAQSESYAADITSIREAKLANNYISSANAFKKGAFKIRGASNAIFSLSDDQAAKGVVTHSSGNHAAAVALAAKLRGIPAYIVIPKNAPKCKVENVKRYGGQVIWSEATFQSRESFAKKVQQETGAVMIHPFNDKYTMSGQGTITLELLEQVPEIDTIIVPISGGGLISGVTLAAKPINPCIRILAAEPKGADDAAQSKAAGRIITLPETNTIADGLCAFLGDLTWPVVQDLVDEIITVDDAAIVDAMRMCYEILKVAVEASGAIGLAAVLSDQFQQSAACKDSKKVGIILSGGNVDLGIVETNFEPNFCHQQRGWWFELSSTFVKSVVGDDEYLTSIHGWVGIYNTYNVRRGLAFVSNKATYGPYGEESGAYFKLDAHHGKIVDFFGHSGQYLDVIGVYTA
ncbi:hypothetical protein Cni_G14575 [Canna indica]|uniref:Serine racemase n=1 Tax=Canna indica TaxID=4628 RepID=A0AAQ3KBY0_9LILI|nr:hypothetical protein Cni_G14575 [Canna indica]